MKRLKRFTALALSLVMGTSLLTGCGNSSNEVNNISNENQVETEKSGEPEKEAETTVAGSSENGSVAPAGVFPIVDEKITLRVAAIDEPYVGVLDDVDFIKWYEEKTNIHIEWVELPKEGYKEKFNLMLTSGNLPDVVLGLKLAATDTSGYGEDGTYLQLDDYIEEYSIEFKKIMEEDPSIKGMITATDGHIYALPTLNDCLHNQYRTRAWINTEWLDTVGMDKPTTTDEFEAVLQAFKDMDPNGNGIADEIPMMGNSLAPNDIVSYLMNAFIPMNASDLQDITTMYMYMNDGKVDFAPNKEEFKEGLKWINSLVEKGLIDPTSFTQDDAQFKQILQNEETVQVGVIRADIFPGFIGAYTQTADHRIVQYEVLPPLEGPNGFSNQPSYLYSSIGAGNFVITSNCEYPEAAFRWADGWYGEDESLYAWYGMEGSGWKLPDEGAIGLNGKSALYERLPVEGAEQTIRITNRLGNNSADLREGEAYDESNLEMKYGTEPVLYFASRELMQYADTSLTVPPLTLTREEASEITNIRTMILDYVAENIALFCLGVKDVDKEWDSYVNEFSVLGLDRLLEVSQEAYERQYK